MNGNLERWVTYNSINKGLVELDRDNALDYCNIYSSNFFNLRKDLLHTSSIFKDRFEWNKSLLCFTKWVNFKLTIKFLFREIHYFIIDKCLDLKYFIKRKRYPEFEKKFKKAVSILEKGY